LELIKKTAPQKRNTNNGTFQVAIIIPSMMSFGEQVSFPKRQRALSFEEIEEEYEERAKRVPFHFSDEDSDSDESDDSNHGVDDSFSMEEISPRFNIERVLGKGSYGNKGTFCYRILYFNLFVHRSFCKFMLSSFL
jgi:hypothetical protein